MLPQKTLDEYNAVKTAVGLFDFSIEGKIKVTGNGRIDFINGLASNDVKNLKEGNGIYAAFLDKLGRVLSDCIIYKFDDFLLLNMGFMGKKNMIKKLKDEAPLGKSEIEDLSLKYGLFSLQGPGSEHSIKSLLGIDLGLKNENDCQIENVTIKNKAIEIIITKSSRTDEGGFDIFFPAEIYTDLKKIFLEHNVTIISNEAYHILRLEAKKPLYGIDFNEKNILTEITEKATSYEKGCFVGQEIIARIKNIAKGKTVKKLFLFSVHSEIIQEKNEKIFCDEKEAGYVTSSAYSVKLKKALAFGFLYKGFHEKDDFRIKTFKASLLK